MAISFAKQGLYERYQVRVCRHKHYYTATFSCSMGKEKALRMAENYERRLINYLNTLPMSSAGRCKNDRSKGTKFEPRLEIDKRWDSIYVVVSYRRSDGVWKTARKSVKTHGLRKAIKLAVKMAKERHVEHPGRVEEHEMPSNQEVKRALRRWLCTQ